MSLSEDSRSLLKLLLGRGKSYADISGLLGVDEAEVRRRAVTAIDEVDPSAPAPDPELTDFLLGQADPITRADVSRRISGDPAFADQAGSLTEQLRLLVPEADIPDPESPAAGKPKPAAKPAPPARPESPETGKSGFTSISGHQRRLIALLLGGALLAAVVILLVTGVFGGGSDDSGKEASVAPTVAVLEPTQGNSGSGKVEFGLDSNANYAANISVEDLAQAGKGKSYTVWLSGSVGAYPIYMFNVDKKGGFAGQIVLNAAIACVIAGDVFPEVKVSLLNTSDMTRLIRQVRNRPANKASLPSLEGSPRLEGLISMPQDAKNAVISACGRTAAQASN